MAVDCAILRLLVSVAAAGASLEDAEKRLATGDQLGAIEVLEQVRVQEPKAVEPRRLLVKLLAWNNGGARIVPVLEELVALRPDDDQLKLDLAQHYIWGGTAKKAGPLYKHLADKHPQDFEIRAKLVQVYLWTSQSGPAIDVLWQMHRLKPKDRPLAERLAKLLIQSSRAAESIPIYESIAEQYPKDRVPLDELVKIYGWTSKGQERISALERIHRLEPDDIAIAAELAQAYQWNERGADAIPLLERLVERKPENTAYRTQLGRQFAATGRTDEAVIHLKRAVDLNPDDTEIRFLLAQLCHWSTCWEESKLQYREVLRRDPNHTKALQASVALRRAHGTTWPSKIELFRDSNRVTRMTATTGFDLVLTQMFNLVGRYSHQYFLEAPTTGTIDQNVDTVLVSLLGRVTRGLELYAGIGGQYAWPDSPTMTANAGLKFVLLDEIFGSMKYTREIYANRIQSVVESIQTNKVQASVYTEPLSWFALSGAVLLDFVDDGNQITTLFGGAWAFPIRKPVEVKLGVTIGYEDATTILPGALPYYTPDTVLAIAPGLDVTATLFKSLTLSAGYSTSFTPGSGIAHIPRASFAWEITPFDTISARFVRTGAPVYTADIASVSFAHRFQ